MTQTIQDIRDNIDAKIAEVFDEKNDVPPKILIFAIYFNLNLKLERPLYTENISADRYHEWK